MKYLMVCVLALLVVSAPAHGGYEGPSPLTNIGVGFSIAFDGAKGIYTYTYKLTNPTSNDGDIFSMKIITGTDLKTDAALSSEGLMQCSKFSAAASQLALQEALSVPVGSAAPNLWSCTYTQIDKSGLGAFRWGASKERALLKPGNSLDGFALTSYGIPSIRQVIIEPDIYLDMLPESYTENLVATIALENKVKWVGKTVGPKAPPKALSPSSFLDYIGTLGQQSIQLGWIKDSGWHESLVAKYLEAKKKIASGDTKAGRNILSALLNEIKAQQDKKITSEGFALLYFNIKYLIDHL